MDFDRVRTTLDRLIRESSNDSYRSVSLLLGKNPAYVQQFIKRGIPKRLDEEDRQVLAGHFGIKETQLGALRPTVAVREGPPAGYDPGAELQMIPVYDVAASAGAGSVVDTDMIDEFLPFRASWLRRMGAANPRDLAVITVSGDSMYPTLNDGDSILVNLTCEVPRRDGIYVLRTEGMLQVKRISINPASGRLLVKSDNRLYESWPDCDPQEIDLLGRVIWVGRRL